MQLKRNEIKNKDLEKYIIPKYNIDEITHNTKEGPKWIHFGAGNIFRAFLASCQQKLLNEFKENNGIIVVEGFDYQIVDYLKKFDNLTINVTLNADGSISKELIASIVQYIKMNPSEVDDMKQLREYFRNPTLQMISLTITEKGYRLKDMNEQYYPDVCQDFKKKPSEAESYLGKICSLLYERFKSGQYPLALVSMDNMSQNGEKLETAIKNIVEKWVENKMVEKEFFDYISNPEIITFPWTMIDKITPRPSEKVKEMLVSDGFENIDPIVTEKNTFIAPFVNGEAVQYLIIEDAFPNGRPKLEDAGIIFTSREVVNRVETMKVTTCLNPLHTALAIFGCLLGYSSIYEEMKDSDLVNMIKILGYKEGLPVVIDPGVLNPKKFLDEVIHLRLSNQFIPDSPQRIATDTSQKLAIRFGNTIRKYLKEGKDLNDLTIIPLVFAGWFRYLQGMDDNLLRIELSSDPFIGKINWIYNNVDYLSEEHLGNIIKLTQDSSIFGIDLVSCGLSDKVLEFYKKMNRGKNAVRTTISEVIGGIIDNANVI
ncbi:mannitol dehydrogenase family protein [Aerococcaceae bacterium zg-BR22]|uniref:mannitol dehydrogenase family protein n=1 Tax=Aerococcaceae bacterium zg-1292 TaxID=2774330 RepID=UPI0040649B72|nr:mannitol dehydrogenase family protein [Aerococcaceae bacterium zg-BR22]